MARWFMSLSFLRREPEGGCGGGLAQKLLPRCLGLRTTPRGQGWISGKTKGIAADDRKSQPGIGQSRYLQLTMQQLSEDRSPIGCTAFI